MKKETEKVLDKCATEEKDLIDEENEREIDNLLKALMEAELSKFRVEASDKTAEKNGYCGHTAQCDAKTNGQCWCK